MCQRIERCLVSCKVGVAPGDLSANRCDTPRRKIHRKCRVSDLEFLVDRYVEWDTIVVQTPAPEDGGSVCFIQRVRETQSRLERSFERFAVVSGSDVSVQVEWNEQIARVEPQRVSTIRVGHMVRV